MCKRYLYFCSKNINVFENTLATTVNKFVDANYALNNRALKIIILPTGKSGNYVDYNFNRESISNTIFCL